MKTTVKGSHCYNFKEDLRLKLRLTCECGKLREDHVDRLASVNFAAYQNCAAMRKTFLDSQAFDHFQYVAQAEVLKDQVVVTEFAKKIEDFYSSKGDMDTPFPFFAIGAPCGSGKTQIAFTLRARGIDVWHVCFVRDISSETVQSVYRHPSVRVTSIWLSDALRMDMLNYEHNDISESACYMLDEDFPLNTICLFSGIFGVREGGQLVATPKAFRHAVRRQLEGRRPLLFVDQAFPSGRMHPGDDGRMEAAKFLRTVVRACGLAAVFVETSAAMVQFVVECGNSRGRGIVPFAEFVGILPPTVVRFDASTVRSPVIWRFFELLQPHVATCNPLLLHEIWESAKKRDTLDQIINVAAAAVYCQKSALLTPDGILAQVLFQLDGLEEAETSLFVNTHFARFRQNYSFSICGNMVSYANSYRSQPPCMFPPSKDDPLLALLLGGAAASQCAHPVAFEIIDRVACSNSSSDFFSYGEAEIKAVSCTLTSAAAYLFVASCYVGIEGIKFSTDHRNGEEPFGGDVECLTVLAAINASRVDGIHGCTGMEFLRSFLLEMTALASNDCGAWAESSPLLPLQFDESQVAWSLDSVWCDAASCRIPFLTRLNDDYPQSLLGPDGLCVGKICRPQNWAACIYDGNEEPVVVFEATLADSGLSLESLRRFEASTAPLCIVVVSPSTTADAAAVEWCEELLQDTNIVQLSVSRDDWTINISPVREISEPRSRLVCVIEADVVQMRDDLMTLFPELSDRFRAAGATGAKVRLDTFHENPPKKRRPATQQCGDGDDPMLTKRVTKEASL